MALVLHFNFLYFLLIIWFYGPMLYILPMFFDIFFIFLMVDFLALVAQTLTEQSSPKFQDW